MSVYFSPQAEACCITYHIRGHPSRLPDALESLKAPCSGPYLSPFSYVVFDGIAFGGVPESELWPFHRLTFDVK